MDYTSPPTFPCPFQPFPGPSMDLGLSPCPCAGFFLGICSYTWNYPRGDPGPPGKSLDGSRPGIGSPTRGSDPTGTRRDPIQAGTTPPLTPFIPKKPRSPWSQPWLSSQGFSRRKARMKNGMDPTAARQLPGIPNLPPVVPAGLSGSGERRIPAGHGEQGPRNPYSH